MKIRKIALAALAPLAAVGFAAGISTAASAAPLVHATTHVANRADSGNGGTWATDNFTRSLTIVKSASQVNAPDGDTLYTAFVVDNGGFTAHAGALAPNQAVPGVHVAHSVNGSFKGGITYTIAAPNADALTGTVPAFENDAVGTPVPTSTWPAQAFATSVGVQVTENAGWSWKYSTACESWTDSSANGDGNLAGDGNITGKICTVPKPYVYAGHVITEDNNTASVGWSDSKFGWPSANKCVEVQEFGFGLSVNGSPHIGFTCDNGNPANDVGFLRGLTPGHTYALRIQPAVGTYLNHHPIPGTNANAHVTVVTTK